MATINYRVGDLRRIVRESKDEFDPVVGPGVEAEDMRNSKESYKKAKERAKDYDGGLTNKEKPKFPEVVDGNRSMADLNPRTEPSKEYQKDNEARLKGYTSALEEKNGIEKAGADFNEEPGKRLTDAAKKRDEAELAVANSGLQSSKLKNTAATEEGTKDSKLKNRLFKESAPKPKRLHFKHTKFVNESKMLGLIPEEYKKDGQKIFMVDSVGNEYTVMCEDCKGTNSIEVNVIGYNNQNVLNEQVERMNQLFGYDTKSVFTKQTPQERVNENDAFRDMMDMMKKI